MKKYFKTFNLPLAVFALLLVGCDRDIDEGLPIASFPTTAEVFTDNPVGLTDQFFNSFDPAVGANTNGFGTDDNVSFAGTSSIRIDVPGVNDPEGTFIGGIFLDRGNGRDLSGYDALTFYLRSSTTPSDLQFGFGTDFIENKYSVGITAVATTDWRKITIPIPDPSKVTQEKGMFLFSAGTATTGGLGYTLWLDEIKFEKLGTTNLLFPFILDSEDQEVSGFIGSNITINNLGATYSLENGQTQTVTAAPSYFSFESTNTNVTGNFGLNSLGEAIVPIVGQEGTAVVTGILGNTLARGSVTINAQGSFPHAPIPSRDASTVISLFSDAYNNVPVRHYNGFFAPFQTTQGGAGNDPNNVDIQAPYPDGTLDNIINYTALNFVSIGTYETVPLTDVSSMTHLHVDINVREDLQAADFIRLSIETGTGQGTVGAGNFTLNSAALANANEEGWVSLDIPLSNFVGLSDLANIGQLFFISDASISEIWVDNVYYYAE